MLLQALCGDKNVLLQQYYSDTARNTLRFFESKEIDICTLQAWQQRFPIIYPWDPIYNTLRLAYNKVCQFFPLLIVMCRKRKDAQWALSIAKKLCVKFAIRSGAHDSNCYSLSNGIIIDVSQRDYIDVDVENETMRVGAGVRIGQIVETLSKVHMTLPAGTCQNVSASGLTLGGGIGFLERKYGLTLDSLLESTMILANEEIVTVNEQQHSDLFWAIRGGGGGSFGINTDFKFRIHKLSSVVLFNLKFQLKYLKEVVRIWQKWAPYTTPNLTSELDLYSPKDRPDGPVRVTGQYAGKTKHLDELLSVFDDLHPEVRIWNATTREAAKFYATAFPQPFGFFRNLFTNEALSEEMLETLYQFFRHAPHGISMELNALKGQLKTLGKTNDTAFPWRRAIIWMLIRANIDSQEELQKLSVKVLELYHAFIKSGVVNRKTGLPMEYVNFKDPKLSKEEYPLVYWGDNHTRLSQVKAKYDPENVFKFAQSVPLPEK